MKRLRLGAGILNQTPLDWEGNTGRIIDAIRMAKEKGVHVLCLPELCITGYGCEDMFLAPHVWRTSWHMLQRIVPETDGMIVSVGLPLFDQWCLQRRVCDVAWTDCRVRGEAASRRRWSPL